MSSILNDPDLCDRLADVVDALARGERLDVALEKARIDPRRGAALATGLAGYLRRRGRAIKGKKQGGRKTGLDVVAFSDGGSRGNPGESACAAILFDNQGNELLRRARRLGKKTNNAAEYEGVLLALELALQLGVEKLLLKVDSELVARQLQGSYKVKNEDMKRYHTRAVELIAGFPSFEVECVRRDLNKEADRMVSDELDGKTS